MAKLVEFCKINMGQSPESSSYNNTKKGIPFFQGNADFGDVHPKVRVWCDTPTKIAHPYDILISVRAPIGALNIADVECCIGRGLASLTVDYDKCHQKYLWYALQSKVDELNAKGTGSTFKAISKSVLFDTEIPLPSLDSQKEISDIFDKITTLIQIRKKQLNNLENLIKSRFIELFGDPNIEFKYQSYKFKEFAIDMTKGPFGSDMKKELFVPKEKDTYKVYIQANAIQGNQDIGDYYISKEYFDSKIFKFEVHPGDYIITCDGTLGKHLKLNDKMERGVISPSLLRLTLNEDKMTKEYFEYIWDMYILLLMKKEARNACLVHLPSAKVIGEIDIPVPPINLQNEFATFVEQTDKLKFEVKQSLEQLETLKKSLMQQYFG